MAMSIPASTMVMEMRHRMPGNAGVAYFDLIVWIATLGLPVLLMMAVAFQPWVAPGDLLRDPLAVAEMRSDCCKVYFGAISNLGVLVWTSAATVCLFAAALIASTGRGVRNLVFMLVAGLFTGFLVLDDLFLVHENVLPAFGVSQPVTYAAYGLIGLIYLAVSWRQILQHRYILFGVAGSLLATSVGIDWLIESDLPIRILLEDGAKLTGIFAWTAFHTLAAWGILAGNIKAARQ